MQPNERSDNGEQQAQPRQDADKLIMRSVVSYDQLLSMIEERNPILAKRDQRHD